MADNIHCELISEERIRLTEELLIETFHGIVAIPKGFESDGATIPRILWPLASPFDDELRVAAVVHDYLYTTHLYGMTMDEADDIFFRLMLQYGTPNWKANIIICAVKAAMAIPSVRKKHWVD